MLRQYDLNRVILTAVEHLPNLRTSILALKNMFLITFYLNNCKF